MAPRKLTQIERWIGTEAERLALDASGFSPGSTFFERDTGSMHKWDGTSWGKEIITVADIAGIKTAIESLDNFGGTAADIGTLKLENGQIKGYDGTDWQPVRVNDAGELILASEVTVNAEGLSVDLGKLVLQAKNPGGVPVDMKSDTEGNLKVSLSGNIALDSSDKNIGRIRTQEREVAAYTYDRIIEELGSDNIIMFLPCWEASGDIISDMLNPKIKFKLGGQGALGQEGVLHPTVGTTNNGAGSALTQMSETENVVIATGESPLLEAGKIAQKIPAGKLSTSPGFVQLLLKRTGTLANARIKITICEDDGGHPGALVGNGESDSFSCSAIATSVVYRGVVFHDKPQLALNKPYWIVLEYADDTGVDASNYISWGYRDTSNYGGARGVYDGSWSILENENHAFKLYNKEVQIPEIFTMLMSVKEHSISEWSAGSRILNRMAHADHSTLGMLFEQDPDGGYLLRLNGSNPAPWTNAATNIRTSFLGDFNTIAVTAEADSRDIFVNGKLYDSITGADPARSFGGLRQPLEFLNNIHASIGPIIITKNRIDGTIAANIHNLLMTRKKIEGGW